MNYKKLPMRTLLTITLTFILCIGYGQTKNDTIPGSFWVKQNSTNAGLLLGYYIVKIIPPPPNCKCMAKHELIGFLDSDKKPLNKELVIKDNW